MNDAIIVLNAGSSSLKFALYVLIDHELSCEARGQIADLMSLPRLQVQDRFGQRLADATLNGTGPGAGYSEAFAHLANWIRAEYGGRLSPLAVGHRVVHGGTEFRAPTPVTPAVLEKLALLAPLAPLHQPHNLDGIRGVMSLRPDLPQVACFDTAFHHHRPAVSERFALPREWIQRGVRRWGFHGLSYQSIAAQLERISPEAAAGKVVVAHLGSGASLCAMSNGRSVETTMGFSVLDGLPMATRCGSLDPGAVLFLLQQMPREELERLLYEQSGLKGLSGLSGDMRELLASPSPQAAEAVEYFVYRSVCAIGSMAGALGGLDALVFTAGVGENSSVIRRRICEGLKWMGISIAAEANERGRGRISTPGRHPSVWVIPTDEEGVIAADTYALARSMTFSARGIG